MLVKMTVSKVTWTHLVGTLESASIPATAALVNCRSRLIASLRSGHDGGVTRFKHYDLQLRVETPPDGIRRNLVTGYMMLIGEQQIKEFTRKIAGCSMLNDFDGLISLRALQYELEIVPRHTDKSKSSRSEQSLLNPFIDSWWSFAKFSITGGVDAALISRAEKSIMSNKWSTFNNFGKALGACYMQGTAYWDEGKLVQAHRTMMRMKDLMTFTWPTEQGLQFQRENNIQAVTIGLGTSMRLTLAGICLRQGRSLPPNDPEGHAHYLSALSHVEEAYKKFWFQPSYGIVAVIKVHEIATLLCLDRKEEAKHVIAASCESNPDFFGGDDCTMMLRTILAGAFRTSIPAEYGGRSHAEMVASGMQHLGRNEMVL